MGLGALEVVCPTRLGTVPNPRITAAHGQSCAWGLAASPYVDIIPGAFGSEAIQRRPTNVGMSPMTWSCSGGMPTARNSARRSLRFWASFLIVVSAAAFAGNLTIESAAASYWGIAGVNPNPVVTWHSAAEYCSWNAYYNSTVGSYNAVCYLDGLAWYYAWSPTGSASHVLPAGSLSVGVHHVTVKFAVGQTFWPRGYIWGTADTGFNVINPNPNVGCSPTFVTVQDVLGTAYPSQNLSGSQYQVNATAGGVPDKRALSPPCTITNIHNNVVSTFVQISRVYLYQYTFNSDDCSRVYAPVNGGGPYPNGQRYCDNVGDIRAIGTTSGYIHVEFDRDWLARGYCGSAVSYCNNVTIAQNVSSGTISLDVQGFVYWDPGGVPHWELHALAAWKLTSN